MSKFTQNANGSIFINSWKSGIKLTLTIVVVIYAIFSFKMWCRIDEGVVRLSTMPIPIQIQWINQNLNNSQFDHNSKIQWTNQNLNISQFVHHDNNSKIQYWTNQTLNQSQFDNGSHFIKLKEEKLVKLLILAYPR